MRSWSWPNQSNFLLVNSVKVSRIHCHCFTGNPKRYTDNRRGTKDNKTDSVEMRVAPIDVRSTTSRHLYLIIIQHLIDRTHEHIEGGNRLRTDVVGCQTPSPCIIKSLNLSLVQDSFFRHILFKISCFLLPIAISMDMPKRTHTHTHMHVFLQYLYMTHKQNKWDSVEPNGGWSRIIATIFRRRQYYEWVKTYYLEGNFVFCSLNPK